MASPIIPTSYSLLPLPPHKVKDECVGHPFDGGPVVGEDGLAGYCGSQVGRRLQRCRVQEFVSLQAGQVGEQVAGLAGLIWSWHPTYTVSMVRQWITNTAVDIHDPGWDDRTGWGRIDAQRALPHASMTHITYFPLILHRFQD